MAGGPPVLLEAASDPELATPVLLETAPEPELAKPVEELVVELAPGPADELELLDEELPLSLVPSSNEQADCVSDTQTTTIGSGLFTAPPLGAP